jgi:hypothetical protein
MAKARIPSAKRRSTKYAKVHSEEAPLVHKHVFLSGSQPDFPFAAFFRRRLFGGYVSLVSRRILSCLFHHLDSKESLPPLLA